MELFYTRIDIAACQKAGDPPGLVVPRLADETWYVPDMPLELNRPINWAQYTKPGEMHIPLFPYLLRPEPELAMAYMLALGLRCSLALPQPIAILHLAVGTPVEQLEQAVDGKSLRYYVGFGFRL